MRTAADRNRIELPQVSRIEVIGNGREYTTWEASGVWAVLQDDGRTLKIFKDYEDK